MSTFNTHGGFFSPQGYFKVNTGGSHDENPNGGVQIGVDPEGVPNMLEEGEPVYNDYVYSDNINADKEILKKHGIPEKFGDMLYSDIADKYVDEAEERPNDPISNNGLNAMLVRLAEAQEEQKQIQKQKELEEELSQMSPEELAELEQILASGGAQAMPEEEIPAEPVQEMEQMPMEQPIMKNGGSINRFDGRTGSLLKRYNRVSWPTTVSYNEFGEPIYDGSDEAITPLIPTGISVRTKSSTPLPVIVDNRPWEERIVIRNGAIGKEYGPVESTAAQPTGKDAKTTSAGSVAPVTGVVPKDYVVPDNFVKILDSEQPGFGVRDKTRERLSKILGKEQKTILRHPEARIDEMEAVRQIVANERAQGKELPKDENSTILPTWMRYTGPLMNGLLALHNAVQKPDKYKIGRYHPIVPSTQMHLVDPVYTPIDTNIGINDLLANSGYTTYGLMQTSGPSAPQTLLAHDYGIGRGLGNVRTAYDDANTQRRNAVIAGINQNATALGNFHNTQNNVWANTFNDARLRNINANLQEQQLNYAAEAQKYAAIQSQLGSLAKALSDIGWENANRNMINGDEAWDYGYGYGFDPNYKATRKKNNGEGV